MYFLFLSFSCVRKSMNSILTLRLSEQNHEKLRLVWDVRGVPGKMSVFVFIKHNHPNCFLTNYFFLSFKLIANVSKHGEEKIIPGRKVRLQYYVEPIQKFYCVYKTNIKCIYYVILFLPDCMEPNCCNSRKPLYFFFLTDEIPPMILLFFSNLLFLFYSN